MEKKLILKLKLDKEDGARMIMHVGEEKYNVTFLKGSNVILGILDLVNIDAEEIDKISQITDLKNLFELIQKGFTIRIEEMEDHLRFIAFKGQASTSCGVSKEMGISSLLKNAEDFAEEFLEDLKVNTACGVEL